jgi:hypothetical protein
VPFRTQQCPHPLAFVLKFRVNVPGGIGRTKRDHRSVNLEDIARTMTPCKPSKIILRDAHYSAAELVTEVQTALKNCGEHPNYQQNWTAEAVMGKNKLKNSESSRPGHKAPYARCQPTTHSESIGTHCNVVARKTPSTTHICWNRHTVAWLGRSVLGNAEPSG